MRYMESRWLSQMLVFSGYTLTVAVFMIVLSKLVFVLLLAYIPLINLPVKRTCPYKSTFDAKKEINSVIQWWVFKIPLPSSLGPRYSCWDYINPYEYYPRGDNNVPM